MPQNLFPSNSLRYCFFFCPYSKGKQTTLLEDQNKLQILRILFQSSPNWSRVLFFSGDDVAEKTRHLRNTYCSSHLLKGTRPDKPHSKRFIHKSGARFRGNIQHNCGLFKSTRSKWSFSTFNNAGKEPNKSQSWIQFVRVLKHTCENKHILIADIVTVIEQGLLSTENR